MNPQTLTMIKIKEVTQSIRPLQSHVSLLNVLTCYIGNLERKFLQAKFDKMDGKQQDRISDENTQMFNMPRENIEGPVKFKVKPTCIKKVALKKHDPNIHAVAPGVKRTFSLKNLNVKASGGAAVAQN